VEIRYKSVCFEPVSAGGSEAGSIHDVVGYTEEHGDYIYKSDGKLGPLQAAQSCTEQMMTDDDVAEEGERHGEPHSHRVTGDYKVRMEQHINHPTCNHRQAVLNRTRQWACPTTSFD